MKNNVENEHIEFKQYSQRFDSNFLDCDECRNICKDKTAIVEFSKDGKTFAEKQLAVAIEALRFYASRDSYRSKNGGHIENKQFNSPIGSDCGILARKTLEELEEENE